jgi:hypothetical protein
VAFLVMLFLVFGLGHVFVALYEFGFRASFVERELTRVLRADRAL